MAGAHPGLAPKVYITDHNEYEEEFEPASVHWFLERAYLKSYEDESFSIFNPGESDLTRYNTEHYFLKYEERNVMGGELSSAETYAHVRRANPTPGVGADWIDIQYWVFYVFKGGSGGAGK
ncbi:MAG: Vps62-related protein [Myxococcota bacterium]